MKPRRSTLDSAFSLPPSAFHVVTEVGVEPTLRRLSTCRLYRLAYPVGDPKTGVSPALRLQLQTWELNPASRLMRPGRAPARLQ
jgi:hypothetical protein